MRSRKLSPDSVGGRSISQIGGSAAATPPGTALQEFRAGWKVLIGSLIGVGIGVSSIPLYTAGVFMAELERGLGWSRSALALGTTVLTFVLAASSPLIGRVIDRHGTCWPLAFSYLAIIAVFIYMATAMSSPFEFYGAMAVMGLFGAAASPVAFTRAINSLFVHARGLALGLMLTGTGLAATLAPAFASWVIEQRSWQAAYLSIAVIVVAFSPVVVALIRVPDSGIAAPGAGSSHSSSTTLADARRSSVFWLILATSFLLAAVVGGLLVHFVPMLLDRGVQRWQASAYAGIIGIAVVFGRIAVGSLVDRFFAPYVAAVVVCCAMVGCSVLAYGDTSLTPLAAFTIGLAIGAEGDLIGFLTARYFGLDNYGAIFGWQYCGFIMGVGVGPLWIGVVYDCTGSYTASLSIALAILALVTVLYCRMPKRSAGSSLP